MPAFPSAASQLGIAIESTRGTPVAPAFWLPYMEPDLQPMLTMLEDKGLRGSAVDIYNLIPGVRHDELGFKGNPYLDSFPVLLRALLGSTDGVTAAPTSTTLAAAPSAGAVTISTTATIAIGSYIAIGSGATLETHLTSNVSGAGPFTVTLATPLLNAQANGATVTGLTKHKIGLLNNASQNQPPSVTLNDFDGGIGRQMTAGQMDSLSIKYAANTLLEYQAKFLGNPFTPNTPSSSFTAVNTVPGWTLVISVGGSILGYPTGGEVNLKRGVKPIEGLDGNQSPYLLFAGPLSCNGKLTVVEQTASPELTNYLAGTVQALDLTWFDVANGNALNIHASQVKFKASKVNRGKEWVEVELDWVGIPNSTDAVAGGVSPIVTTTANAQVAAY